VSGIITTVEEYAVEVTPGVIIECCDLEDAQATAAKMGTRVLVRHVYESGWDEASE
jgi:hypothetical protein